MAEPTTRSGLATRVAALETELAELRSGAYKLGYGADGGTDAQKDAAFGLSKRIGELSKALDASGVKALKGKLTA